MLSKGDGDKSAHTQWWGHVPSIPSVSDTYDLIHLVRLYPHTHIHTHLPPLWTSQRLLLPNGSVSSSRATSSPSSRLRSCSWQPLHFLFSWYRRLTGYSASSQARCSSVWCCTSGIWRTAQHKGCNYLKWVWCVGSCRHVVGYQCAREAKKVISFWE